MGQDLLNKVIVLKNVASVSYKTLDEVKAADRNKAKNKASSATDFAGFDLDAFEAKLNRD